MEFEIEIEGIQLKLNLVKDDLFSPCGKSQQITKKCQKLLRSKALAFYTLSILASKEGTNMEFLLPGLLLSTQREERIEELEILLEEEGKVEAIYDRFQTLNSDKQTPPWAQ